MPLSNHTWPRIHSAPASLACETSWMTRIRLRHLQHRPGPSLERLHDGSCSGHAQRRVISWEGRAEDRVSECEQEC